MPGNRDVGRRRVESSILLALICIQISYKPERYPFISLTMSCFRKVSKFTAGYRYCDNDIMTGR
jgi:hypothetical protein